MSEIRIYLEGGGDSTATKARLRKGMDEFLKQLKDQARERRWRWNLVPCGGRQLTYDAFSNAGRSYPKAITILLVDSEEAVGNPTPAEHLRCRDGWALDSIPNERLHLMAQCMETWLVSDRDALAKYYGKGFHGGSLPTRANLEEEAKQTVYEALDAATRHTQKGPYGKIKHAADLLKRIDAGKARQRCRHCKRLFNTPNALLTQPE